LKGGVKPASVGTVTTESEAAVLKGVQGSKPLMTADEDLLNVYSNQIGGKPLGTPTGIYDMVTNPGPLMQLPNNPAANFAGGRYTSITLSEDTVLYRGGSSTGNPLGQWFTSDAPASVAQVRIDTAVRPQWIDQSTGVLTGQSPIDTVYSVKIPAGTTIYIGPTASQGGVYVGGNSTNQTQIFIPRTTNGLTVINSSPIQK
jgi:filamentous hemagglutinin